LAQVIRVERERRVAGEATVEVAYFITSLDRGRADAARLLDLIRSHGHIENRLHHVRDVSLGEDACRVRTGSSPHVLAALRNTAIHLLEGVDATSKASAMRRFAAHPDEAISLIRG
jgi:predicted transposase YbfD/YdcC